MNVHELFDLIGVILMFNADSDNHVISLSCGRKTSLHTRVPISHVEPFLLYYLFNFLYTLWTELWYFKQTEILLNAERRRSISDISEYGVEQEQEIVNLELSWSRVIIKCSEHREEIFEAPFCSHTLVLGP